MSREIRITWFGRLADARGLREEALATDARTAGELFAELSARHALDAGLRDLQIAVNDEFAVPDQPLNAGDRVVFMPPFSGG
jgi:molybdopterin converting factor small subunit